MSACALCGKERVQSYAECPDCGAASPINAGDGQSRRTVTVVFSDLVDSTSLGERLDPEALHNALSQYYGRMRAVLERHGGHVREFIGDGVMAIFGVPELHEDDAVRAVRAALEMRAELSSLNQELSVRFGVQLQARTGINTGEVVTGAPSVDSSFVVGDAVNVAARLEQVALPGDVLVGEATLTLLDRAVDAEAFDALQLKGKSDPVRAFRIRSLDLRQASSSQRSRFIAREQELATLKASLKAATDLSRGQVTSVIGPAGIGKSRLVEEMVGRLDRSIEVLRGRCLPYGEGITLWPLGGIVKSAAGIGDGDEAEDAAAKIRALLEPSEDADQVMVELAGAIGLIPHAPKPAATFWAAGRLLEAVASRSPVVIVFDDLQWGEELFLDLVEHLRDNGPELPWLIICVGRDELREKRPSLASRDVQQTLRLEGLAPPATRKLVSGLLGGAPVADEISQHVASASHGNPLFVDEMVRVLHERSMLELEQGEWRARGSISGTALPPTIHALLASRLSRLEPAEQELVGSAAVVGQEFWEEAVIDLSPRDRAEVAVLIEALRRKDLIEPLATVPADEHAFRFCHLLIRDVAYESVLKEKRSALHERFAGWLEQRAGRRVTEYEEIIGYHLEQAHRYRCELGPEDAASRQVAARAAAMLGPAGRRALNRGDMPAAASLLGRALQLTPRESRDQEDLALNFGIAVQNVGDREKFEELLSELVADSAELPGTAMAAHLNLLMMEVYTTTSGSQDSMQALVRTALEAIPGLEKEGDAWGLAGAWLAIAFEPYCSCRFEQAIPSMERALEALSDPQHRRAAAEIADWLIFTRSLGPRSRERAVPPCEDFFWFKRGDKPVMASVAFMNALFEAMAGNAGRARALCERGRLLLEDCGSSNKLATFRYLTGRCAEWGGDAELAADEYRLGLAELREAGETFVPALLAARLGSVLVDLGHHAEAKDALSLSSDLTSTTNLLAHIASKTAMARLQLAAARPVDAARVAAEAVELGGPTDALIERGEASLVLGRALLATGDASGAAKAAAEASRHFRAKGHQVGHREAQGLADQAETVSAQPAT